ncbi:zinc ABC transporter substrate-binding protein [bacterium]|nr:zinc ABC transporter substrate-binding protein [bacterium]
MKRCILALAVFACFSQASARRVQVVATYPYIAEIVEKVGGENVRVHALARGDWNPHTIVPRPSFIAHLRKADLLVINGGQLEIGWLPPLLNQANNPKIQAGTSGLLDLSGAVTMIDVPSSVSRAQGDVHPEGNPHYYLDPANIPILAEAVAERLSEMEPGSAAVFSANLKSFSDSWAVKLSEWENRLKPLSGAMVIEYHKNFDYFMRRFQLKLAGTLEPLPGIPPTSRHIEGLEQIIKNTHIRFILQDIYNPDAAARHLSQKYKIPMVALPHDVGAVPGAEGIVTLFDEIVGRLTHE